MKALIIVGSERRFFLSADAMRKFLKERALFEEIGFLLTAYWTPRQLLGELDRFLEKVRPGEMSLIAYAGHGGDGYWGLSPGCDVYYEDVAARLNALPGPCLFVNDCCLGGSALPWVRRCERAEERIGFIGAYGYEDFPGGERLTYPYEIPHTLGMGGLVREVLRLWDKSKYFPDTMVIEQSISVVNSFIAEGVTIGEDTFIVLDDADSGCYDFEIYWTYKTRWGARFDHHFFPKRENT